ncbi:hypothetical protein SEVIR_3G399800v4 [Setaria viridis]|uniref:Knottin scorpion toxin-like domain-containing protein n=2 Tax=Setaria TaxID=4554 RepID=K3ZB04_SETIT|nr:uncharacterized protein LOC101776330 [Setaria italica]XP_034584617.1 uncharacterized protein LOC117847512 [Setaria viridis]RCV19424.1 hypothetical protein SETIT_3G383100v2 [Setaria italica]TKW29509.1 hypothetical protein SEVIR_3G399800v2 [Setaria viridis]
MKNKSAATALVLLLLTFGAEVKGSCNKAACNLACMRMGYQYGGRCVGTFLRRYCKCRSFWKDVDDARVGAEQGGDDGGKAPPPQYGLGEDELATFMVMARRGRGHV